MHEYPTPQPYQQYSQPAAGAFYDPGASQPASQHGSQYDTGSQPGSQYGVGSQQGSVPASPAWGAGAAPPPAFFNPNAGAQPGAQTYPAPSQPPRVPFQQQPPPPQWVGSGVEDSAAQWGYAQQQQWHAGK